MIRNLSPFCLLIGAMSCSPVPDESDGVNLSPATASHREARLDEALQTAKDDCLLMVWSEQAERAVAFDRAHDRVKGGAISCATGTTASQFEVAILAIREAAKSGNQARMLEQIGLPLLYIDSEGKRRPIESREMVEQIFDEVFDARMLETLGRLDLADMTVVPEQGAFFELGSLWLVVDEKGGRPSIVTVNRQALDDAARAAREKASHNQATPIPAQ